jgi:hypothetical protein
VRCIHRMRFFAFSLAVALTAAGVTAPTRAPSSDPPIVILVHGRGHLDEDSAGLRRAWKRDLDSALSSVGMPRLRDEDVRLAWYADVLDPESETACSVTGTTADDSLDFGVIARGFLGSLTSTLARDESRGLRGLLGDMLYVLDGSKRCAAERRVGNAIESAVSERRPVVVVAYSLGSVVTFGFLNSRAPNAASLSDVRLITLGSPLGVRELRELLLGETGDTLRVPTSVRAWENVYDPYDTFSAPLERIVSGKRVRDHVTQSESSDDAHHIDRYLRDRATGAALARALCATSKERIGAACGRLPVN